MARPLDDYVKVIQAFLAKSDGRDKMLATIQYAAMFAAAGQAGNALSVQKSLGTSRKPFRFMKPAEILYPLITTPPKLNATGILGQVKALSWVAFFLFDHVTWAGSIGIVKDKERVDKSQKISFYGWLLASICQLLQEGIELEKSLAVLSLPEPAPESPEAAEVAKKRTAAKAAVKARGIAATTVGAQAIVAAGLLQLIPLKPRTIGAFGVLTSVLACYQLLPPLPPPAAKAKSQ